MINHISGDKDLGYKIAILQYCDEESHSTALIEPILNVAMDQSMDPSW